ncbi:TonB-dependent receptor [Sporomusa malonica]|uniref:Outer membrane cobalamin receptor protein n=1 Tax=Sporomusa malonica TaxID=112901 RepID=A0A1W2EZD1_9FIRM|nr:TonB-dependent receptor [Sporomusa malonica]SMD14586.1 Outer membrane cobalamin receptor protein [Sporomusa malonica]
MRKNKKIAALAGCILVGSSFVSMAAAEEAKSSEEVTLEEVVVTSSKLYATKITVITENEIKAKGAQNVAEALKDVTGLNVVSSSSKGKSYAQFRGSDANSTKVFVDGVLLSTVGDGRTDLRTIATDNIEKIEVIKGPVPVIYGSNATGGVIYITTKNGSNSSNSISIARGSNNTEKYMASFGGDAGNVKYYFGVKKESTDGYTDHSNESAVYYNGKLNWSLNPKASLTVFGSYSETKEQIPNRYDSAGNLIINSGRGGCISQQNKYFSGTYNWEYDPIKQSYIGVVYDQKLNDSSDLSLKTYRSTQKSLLFTSGYQKLDWDGTVEGYELQHTIRTSRINTATWGYSYEKGNFTELTSNIDGTYNRADYTYTGKSYYIQDVIKFNNRLNANFGYRHNENEDHIKSLALWPTYGSISGTYTSDNPVFSLNYKISGNTELHGSIGKSYRYPNAMERSAPGGIYNGVTCNYLLPEKAINREIGLSHVMKSGLDVEVTYFHKNVTDMIKSTGQGGGRNQYFNIPKVEMHGFEAEINRKLSDCTKAFVNYSYTNAYDTLKKRQVSDIPYRNFSYGLNYLKNGLNANLAVSYIGGRTSLFSNGNGNGNSDGQNAITPVSLAGYHVVDLKVSKVIDKREYYVKVQNLLDKQYYLGAYLIAPGRYVEIGTTMKF